MSNITDACLHSPPGEQRPCPTGCGCWCDSCQYARAVKSEEQRKWGHTPLTIPRDYYVQRKKDGVWVSEPVHIHTLATAKAYADTLPLEGDKPEALRIVDAFGNVVAWVSRNGYLPGGALPPVWKTRPWWKRVLHWLGLM